MIDKNLSSPSKSLNDFRQPETIKPTKLQRLTRIIIGIITIPLITALILLFYISFFGLLSMQDINHLFIFTNGFWKILFISSIIISIIMEYTIINIKKNYLKIIGVIFIILFFVLSIYLNFYYHVSINYLANYILYNYLPILSVFAIIAILLTLIILHKHAKYCSKQFSGSLKE